MLLADEAVDAADDLDAVLLADTSVFDDVLALSVLLLAPHPTIENATTAQSAILNTFFIFFLL